MKARKVGIRLVCSAAACKRQLARSTIPGMTTTKIEGSPQGLSVDLGRLTYGSWFTLEGVPMMRVACAAPSKREIVIEFRAAGIVVNTHPSETQVVCIGKPDELVMRWGD